MLKIDKPEKNKLKKKKGKKKKKEEMSHKIEFCVKKVRRVFSRSPDKDEQREEKRKVVVSSSHMYLVHAVLVRSLRGHRGSRYIRGSFVADIADKGF